MHWRTRSFATSPCPSSSSRYMKQTMLTPRPRSGAPCGQACCHDSNQLDSEFTWRQRDYSELKQDNVERDDELGSLTDQISHIRTDLETLQPDVESIMNTRLIRLKRDASGTAKTLDQLDILMSNLYADQTEMRKHFPEELITKGSPNEGLPQENGMHMSANSRSPHREMSALIVGAVEAKVQAMKAELKKEVGTTLHEEKMRSEEVLEKAKETMLADVTEDIDKKVKTADLALSGSMAKKKEEFQAAMASIVDTARSTVSRHVEAEISRVKESARILADLTATIIYVRYGIFDDVDAAVREKSARFEELDTAIGRCQASLKDSYGKAEDICHDAQNIAGELAMAWSQADITQQALADTICKATEESKSCIDAISTSKTEAFAAISDQRARTSTEIDASRQSAVMAILKGPVAATDATANHAVNITRTKSHVPKHARSSPNGLSDKLHQVLNDSIRFINGEVPSTRHKISNLGKQREHLPAESHDSRARAGAINESLSGKMAKMERLLAGLRQPLAVDPRTWTVPNSATESSAARRGRSITMRKAGTNPGPIGPIASSAAIPRRPLPSSQVPLAADATDHGTPTGVSDPTGSSSESVDFCSSGSVEGEICSICGTTMELRGICSACGEDFFEWPPTDLWPEEWPKYWEGGDPTGLGRENDL